MSFAVARAWCACVLLCLGAFVQAQPAPSRVDPTGALTLAQAVQAALTANPELHASAYSLTAAQARLLQAGLRPNPQLDLELENFAGTGDSRGLSSLETTLSLSQVVELGGKRGLRQALAQADVDATALMQRARELDVLAEVTRRFITVVVAQERSQFAAEAAELAQQTFAAIDARVTAGRSPEAERSRARIAVLRADIEQQQARSELRSARHALAAMWGNPQPSFKQAQAALFDLRPLETAQALLRTLEDTPELLLLASQSRLHEAQLRLARAQARPDLTLSVGVRHFNDSDDAALVAGFSMPLPWSDRNQGSIGEAQTLLTQSEAQRDAAALQARSTLLALHQEMTTAARRVRMLREEVVPQAARALEQTRAGFERGRFSFLELASAQQDLLALRAAAIDAAADHHRMSIEIERLISTALTGPAR